MRGAACRPSMEAFVAPLRLKFVLMAAAAGLCVAAAAVLVVQSRQARESSMHAAHAPEAGGWYCPMHLHVTADHEGSCPICGMDLVQRTQAPMEAHSQQVSVAPQMQARLGVVTESIQPVDFSPAAAVAAQVVADERRAVTLSPKVEGWITRLGVSGIGQAVRAGQVLYEIYSPELQQRQKDYIDLLTRRDSLLAAKGGESGMVVGNASPDLMLASVARERYRVRNRLIAADVPVSVLNDLERFRRVQDVVPVLAAHDGVITSIGAREGAFVTPGEIVVSYADRHAAWAEIILTPDLLSQIQPGDAVELRSTFERDVMVTSRLDPALAVVDPVSRTARVRVPLAATAHRFLPGTLLEGRIKMKTRRSLTVPADTVLRTGRGDFVIVAESDNHFRPTPVRLGAESGDRIEVLEGLDAGQSVVANGQFMLSAESSLQSSWNRFAATTQAVEHGDIEVASTMHHGKHAAVEVAKTMQHEHGKAADIAVAPAMSHDKSADVELATADSSGHHHHGHEHHAD